MLRKMKNYLQFVVIAVSVMYALYLFRYKGLTVNDILAFVRDNPWKMLATILLLYAFKACCAIVPYSGLVLAAAVSFPLATAIAINLFGSFICFSISYLFGRMTPQERLEKKLEENRRIAPYVAGAKEKQGMICFANHLMGLSSEVLGMLYGLMRTPFFVYLSTSVLGTLPCVVLVSIAGKMDGLKDWRFYFFVGLNYSLKIIGYTIMFYRVAQIRKKKERLKNQL